MKKLITACFLACTLPLFAQEKLFEIKGEVANPQVKTVYLSYQSKNEIDSAAVVNHKFRFTGKTQEIEFIALKVGYLRYPTVIEPGNLSVSFVNENPNDVVVAGQQPAIDSKSYLLMLSSFSDRIELIRKKHQEAAVLHDTVTMEALGKENDQTYADRILAAKQWTTSHLSAMISPYIIQQQLKSLSAVELEKLYNGLNAKVKASIGGLSLALFIKRKKTLMVGQVAPVFHQKTSTGSSFSLTDVNGNYVLLDFWAFWCVPCRQENPQLLKLYDRFKNKNFKIVGISLDEYKNSWLKAIKDDHLTWYQLSDLKGWKNEVAMQYNIGALPTTFLLDSQLNIIAINPEMEALNAILESVLK